MRFYLSGNKDNEGNLGVVDREDNVEEFYPRGYLENLDIEIIGINKELELGYKFGDECFIYKLIEIDGIKGWQLHYRNGVSKFRCKSMEFSYPIISLEKCFYEYEGSYIDVSGMDTSNVLNMCMMFYRCNSIISLDLSSLDTSNVIDMSSMFFGCEKLISLDVSNFDTRRVENMSSMFSGCKCLTSLDVSNFDTSNVIDMTYMFSVCKCLTSLDMSNFNTSKVFDMSGMFCDCNNLLIVSNSSRLIEQSKNDNVSSLVSFSVCDINFDTIIKVSKNFDLDFLYKKLKMLGLLGGKVIGYKFE